MSRSLSLSLSKTYITTTTSTATNGRALPLRQFSTLPFNGGDVSEETSTDPLLRKLEEAIHRIIARRSAPDWLPFVPGASYWVPPPRSSANGGTAGLAQLVEKLANPLSYEESLSFSTSRGWPSSDFFIKGRSPQIVEVKADLNKDEVDDKSHSLSKSGEEEG